MGRYEHPSRASVTRKRLSSSPFTTGYLLHMHCSCNTWICKYCACA